MNTTRPLLGCALTALLALGLLPPRARAAQQPRSPMTFLAMIASADEEKQASVLVASLRAFGGDYAQAPVIVVLADPSRADGRSLEGKVQQLLPLSMNEKLRRFPFSDKVYACAQVEGIVEGSTDWLVWLNPDCLILAPPGEIAADPAAWASLRPVHIQNVGSLAGEPLSEFWRRVYESSRLDASAAWTVESYVDGRKLRGYFNSGCMAFSPGRGILRAWRDAYEALLLDPGNLAFFSSDRQYAIYCHQAVLSAVVMARAGRNRVHPLPPEVGYPLGFQDQPGFAGRRESLSGVEVAICGGYGNLGKIRVEEPLKSWIEAHVR